MDKQIFIDRLSSALKKQQKTVLQEELNGDFVILKSQRSLSALHLYWALRSLPFAVREQYLQRGDKDVSSEQAETERLVKHREQKFNTFELMALASTPTLEVLPEQREGIRKQALKLHATHGLEPKIRNRCGKKKVVDAFTSAYSRRIGRKLAKEPGSIFHDKVIIANMDFGIEWDFGGWAQFRESFKLSHNPERTVLLRGSLCEWLGYGPLGWEWILDEDLEEAAAQAAEQTLKFQLIIQQGLMSALKNMP